MRLFLLPEVRKDLKEIIAHYKKFASASVAEDFQDEFRRAARAPTERRAADLIREC